VTDPVMSAFSADQLNAFAPRARLTGDSAPLRLSA
jgi:hypothetical protein